MPIPRQNPRTAATSTRRITRAKRASSRRERPRTESGAAPNPVVAPEERRAMIAEAAYFRAQARGFEPGREIEDWLAAEKEIDAALLEA